MEIRPIRTDEDHRAALAAIDALWDAAPGSPEADRLDVLATLVEEYERRRAPLEAPDPIEAILFRIEQMGLSRRDLEPYVGGRGRLSEVLNRKRGLSLTMIRKLHADLDIPAEVLIGTQLWVAEIEALGITVTGNARWALASLEGQVRRRPAHAIRIIQATIAARRPLRARLAG